ncbi:MAG: hypothetical protein AB1505_36295 [Candidatus Latescibacterota bacterium]
MTQADLRVPPGHRAGGISRAALAVLLGAAAAPAGPRIYDVGLAVTSPGDAAASAPQVQLAGVSLRAGVEAELAALVTSVGRCRTHAWQVQGTDGDYVYAGGGPVDFVAHLVVHRFGRIYRNRLVPRGLVGAASATPSPYEVLSFPAVAARFELRLVDPERGRVHWSATRDSTLLVPYDRTRFILNPERYPGWTHPDMLQAHLVGILRLQHEDAAVGSTLSAADVWFVSSPADAAQTAQRLLTELTRSFAPELDAGLPLEGRIAEVRLSGEGETQAVVDIGGRHGLTPRLRLEVRRAAAPSPKVGQLEVICVDSTTALARLRKLEKPFRQSGEGLQVGDRVVSRRRDVNREKELP